MTVEHIGEFYGVLVTAWTFKGKRIDKCESKKYLNVDKTLTSCILGTLDNNKVGISNPKNSRVGGVKTQFTEKRERKQMKDVPNPWSSKEVPITEVPSNYFIPTRPGNIKRLVLSSVVGNVGIQGISYTINGKANTYRVRR